MKLYAITKSERATKGQGGNEYLYIDITDDKKNVIAKISINPVIKDNLYTLRIDYDRYTTDIKRIPWDDWNKEQRKGKQ